MAMMSRFLRIFKADLHGVMDQLEDKKLLLKQSIREMEEELDTNREKLRTMQAARNQLKNDAERQRIDRERLDRDITTAFAKDREEIARQLVRRHLALTKKSEELAGTIDLRDQECERLAQEIVEQEEQYQRITIQASAYLQRTEPRDFPWEVLEPEPEISDEEVELAFLKYRETHSVPEETEQGGMS